MLDSFLFIWDTFGIITAKISTYDKIPRHYYASNIQALYGLYEDIVSHYYPIYI